MGQAFDLVSEFQDSEEVLLFSELFLLLNLCAQVIDKIFKVRECLLSEILGRWRVLLNTLQVLDRLERLLSLLIDDGGESVILLGDLLDDLFLDTLLLHNRALHRSAFREGALSRTEKLLKLADLELTGLSKGHTATTATVQIEVAIVAQGLIVNLAVSGEGVLVFAHANIRGGKGNGCGLRGF